MITKILIKNYRSIKRIEINNITNSLGLIGENSSGKSAILSAILAFLGEYKIKDSDFRFDKNGNREKEIIIGVGIDFDDYAVKRILDDFALNENKPEWYTEVLDESKGKRLRHKESKAYLKDLRKNIKNKLGIAPSSSILYFKIVYTKDDKINEMVYLTNNKFTENINIQLEYENLKQIKSIVQPKYAYLNDERNFNDESIGRVDSTTNKLFSLLLPAMSIENDIKNEEIENTIISKLSIPQINKYLLNKVQNEAKNVTKKLNQNFKESYDSDRIEIEWNFSNKLFENINIKTNFKFSNINTNIDFQSVGSGTRSMYKLALLQTLLEMKKKDSEPVLFLLEEPELYLYPKLQKQLSQFIFNIAKENQVFVTTHSHMSLASFQKGSVYKIYRENETKHGLPVTKAQAIESSLDVMRLLGYDISYLLNRDYLIFVEGKEDESNYKHLVEQIFGSEVTSKFLVMTGVQNLEMALNCSVLKHLKANYESVYIIDSDGDESQVLKDKVIGNLLQHDTELTKADFENKIIITEYCMLECYTFKKELLKNNMSDEQFLNKKIQFMSTYHNEINNILKIRKKLGLDDPTIQNKTDDEKFEYVRKFGFNKKLIKSFMRSIGGSGFKKIKELEQDELKKHCSSLINDLENIFKLS